MGILSALREVQPGRQIRTCYLAPVAAACPNALNLQRQCQPHARSTCLWATCLPVHNPRVLLPACRLRTCAVLAHNKWHCIAAAGQKDLDGVTLRSPGLTLSSVFAVPALSIPALSVTVSVAWGAKAAQMRTTLRVMLASWRHQACAHVAASVEMCMLGPLERQRLGDGSRCGAGKSCPAARGHNTNTQDCCPMVQWINEIKPIQHVTIQGMQLEVVPDGLVSSPAHGPGGCRHRWPSVLCASPASCSLLWQHPIVAVMPHQRHVAGRHGKWHAADCACDCPGDAG